MKDWHIRFISLINCILLVFCLLVLPRETGRIWGAVAGYMVCATVIVIGLTVAVILQQRLNRMERLTSDNRTCNRR